MLYDTIVIIIVRKRDKFIAVFVNDKFLAVFANVKKNIFDEIYSKRQHFFGLYRMHPNSSSSSIAHLFTVCALGKSPILQVCKKTHRSTRHYSAFTFIAEWIFFQNRVFAIALVIPFSARAVVCVLLFCQTFLTAQSKFFQRWRFISVSFHRFPTFQLGIIVFAGILG